MDLQEHVSFLSLTTFGAGGSARYVASGKGKSDVAEVLRFAESLHIPCIPLGGGSNMLGCDGVSSAVYFTHTDESIEHRDEGNTAEVVVSSGAIWDSAVLYAVQRGLFGFENLSGIPGTVGGAIVQNIGAYGSVLSDSVLWVEVFDTKEKVVRIIDKTKCAFGYRSSLFKKEQGRYVVLKAGFRLQYDGALNISYKDVRDSFGLAIPELASVRDAILTIRSTKFPDIQIEGTAGSFFKNPIVSSEVAKTVQERFPTAPMHEAKEEGGMKISLAWFLDHALHLNGYAVGDVRCFETQPLVIVAKKGTSAVSVRSFARMIQVRVQQEIGLEITPEVCVIQQNILTSGLTF